MEAITTSVLLLCLISLTNANRTPVIDKRVYQVCEDTPIDEAAFTIEASDVENDKLTYELSGININYFSVNRDTGVVTVKRQLDREAQNTMEITATVSDGGTADTEELTIILLEANDNAPLFEKPSYLKDVPENTAVNSTLFSVRATDPDTASGGYVRYNIDESAPGDGLDYFTIADITGEVKLSKALNYSLQNTNYRLKINASDNGGKCFFSEKTYHSSIVFALITILDVPDLDPTFVNPSYSARVEENSPKGHPVVTVTALDQDTGVMDGITYSIEASTVEGLFEISPTTGSITVKSVFDRELVGNSVMLTVKATELNLNIHGANASTTTNVIITIVDVNDEKPKFHKCGGSCVEASEFTGEVLEHQLGSVPINMSVVDLDENPDTVLTLEGEAADVFAATKLSDNVVQLVVRNSQKLDFELQQQMVFRVIAVDNDKAEFRATATVTINILDANDNTPSFLNDTYKLTVDEHSRVGTTVSTITANDIDTMDQDQLVYRLLPESILPIFDVERRSGAIIVKSESLLDREMKSVHSMTLQATDTAGQIGATAVEITLADINDQKPVANRDSYLEYVREGEELSVKIQATDLDEPNKPNSRITYGIMPGSHTLNFTIDPEGGELRNSGVLDREALDVVLDGRVELNVTATDGGSPPLSTYVKVTINVEDVNDNEPQFEAPLYKFSVKEGTKGAEVGAVFAKDLDQTTNFNRISFSIIAGSFGSFIIRTTEAGTGYRGDITVDPDVKLDYESDRNTFSLLVRAADLEQKKAEVTVEVEVLDVNDERPVFLPSTAVQVKENTTVSEAVGRFTATDRDGNHSLVFQLQSVRCRCDAVMTPCSWFVLDPTGDVRVNPEQTVDYEQCDQAVVTAQVVDLFTEMGENNSASAGEMVINIEDINDNTPKFILSDLVFVVVSESASKGTSVGKVTAVDDDSGVNRQVEFKVTEVRFEDQKNEQTSMRVVFEAVTTQQRDTYVGIIQTTEGLDLTLKGKYLVTVDATDPGGLFSSTILEIFTVDESFKVELEFEASEIELEKKLTEIKRTLMEATKAAIEIVAIRPGASEASRASETTVLVAYFVYTNGTALTSDEVLRMLSDPDYYPRLTQLGLKYIGQSEEPSEPPPTVQYVLLGMVGGLVIALAILTTSLFCTRRNYRRKLKASKAMNSASMVTSENQKSGPVVPGTNKYTKEGANPVLNVIIDTSISLDMDEESSDVDKVSLNSLDYNDSSLVLPDGGVKTNMLMIEEEEEDNSGPPEYIEPLGAALAQRGKKKSTDKSQEGLTNPAFDTTDL